MISEGNNNGSVLQFATSVLRAGSTTRPSSTPSNGGATSPTIANPLELKQAPRSSTEANIDRKMSTLTWLDTVLCGKR